MAEAAFSEDGKYFSAISHDGRLKIWDTETNVLKQEYTPDLHLTSPPSCLQWLSVTQSAGPSNKKVRRKSSASEIETQCIALGTNSGKILIYSVPQAKVETILLEKNDQISKNSITCLDWHRKYGLYSCNKDGVAYEWDLQSAAARYKYNLNVDIKNKHSSFVSAIKVIPHNKNTQAKYIATSSTQVRIWRLHNGDADLMKCLGHSAATKAVMAITSLNNMCWLVEGSQNERLLSFWDVTITDDHLPQLNGEELTPNKKKLKKSTTNPVVIPTPMYSFVLEDAPKLIDVEMTLEKGTKMCLSATTRSGVVHYYTHLLNGSSTKPIKPTVTLQVTTADAKPLSLLAARSITGPGLLLAYTQGAATVFERVTPDLKSKTQVLIKGDLIENKQKNKQNNEVNKVRSEISTDVTYAESAPRKRAQPGGTIEVPLEERLSNLSAAEGGPSSGAGAGAGLPRLLLQGLSSGDKTLTMSVLNGHRAVAGPTAGRLPAAALPPLLAQLNEMLGGNTQQCASACVWLRAVSRRAAALPHNAALPELLAKLTHRRAALAQLLNLKGRLELAAAQRLNTHQPAAPVLDYDDTSSSSSENEEEEASSDHSWHSDDSGGE